MKNFSWKKFLNEFEIYLAALIFAIMTVLLFVQVVSRYVFNHSVTWAEELATIMFAWMVYLGCAGAVTRRKHLCIDAVVTAMPFKVRKVMLIIDDIVFAIFAIYMFFPMMTVVNNYLQKNAVSTILRIPKGVTYAMMPIAMVMICIRIVPDILKLIREEEKELGKSKPTLDMDALEAYAREQKALKEKEADK